jgi:hypothetical protein
MGSRLELHDIFLDIVDNVYHQPPSSVRMNYPCIKYELSDIRTDYADSTKYKNKKQYTVTIMDTNPDTTLLEDLLQMEYCSFDTHFAVDNLHHFVFTLFY